MEAELVLLRRFTRMGDAEAFREIIRRHAGLVYGAALRILEDVDRASDVVQETFLQLTKDAATVRVRCPAGFTASRRTRPSMPGAETSLAGRGNPSTPLRGLARSPNGMTSRPPSTKGSMPSMPKCVKSSWPTSWRARRRDRLQGRWEFPRRRSPGESMPA